MCGHAANEHLCSVIECTYVCMVEDKNMHVPTACCNAAVGATYDAISLINI